jgi:hypothetical protein
MSIANVLNRVADYFERHPAAWGNGLHLGRAVVESVPTALGDRTEAIEALRESIGAAGVAGSLAHWSSKHTVHEAIVLLRKTARLHTMRGESRVAA